MSWTTSLFLCIPRCASPSRQWRPNLNSTLAEARTSPVSCVQWWSKSTPPAITYSEFVGLSVLVHCVKVCVCYVFVLVSYECAYMLLCWCTVLKCVCVCLYVVVCVCVHAFLCTCVCVDSVITCISLCVHFEGLFSCVVYMSLWVCMCMRAHMIILSYVFCNHQNGLFWRIWFEVLDDTW